MTGEYRGEGGGRRGGSDRGRIGGDRGSEGLSTHHNVSCEPEDLGGGQGQRRGSARQGPSPGGSAGAQAGGDSAPVTESPAPGLLELEVGTVRGGEERRRTAGQARPGRGAVSQHRRGEGCREPSSPWV